MTLVPSGIAADTMRINGAIRQFKQVSHIIVAWTWTFQEIHRSTVCKLMKTSNKTHPKSSGTYQCWDPFHFSSSACANVHSTSILLLYPLYSWSTQPQPPVKRLSLCSWAMWKIQHFTISKIIVGSGGWSSLDVKSWLYIQHSLGPLMLVGQLCSGASVPSIIDCLSHLFIPHWLQSAFYPCPPTKATYIIYVGILAFC